MTLAIFPLSLPPPTINLLMRLFSPGIPKLIWWLFSRAASLYTSQAAVCKPILKFKTALLLDVQNGYNRTKRLRTLLAPVPNQIINALCTTRQNIMYATKSFYYFSNPSALRQLTSFPFLDLIIHCRKARTPNVCNSQMAI